jgi:hypothetical protein
VLAAAVAAPLRRRQHVGLGLDRAGAQQQAQLAVTGKLAAPVLRFARPARFSLAIRICLSYGLNKETGGHDFGALSKHY